MQRRPVDPSRLVSRFVAMADAAPALVRALYDLFSRYYDDVDPARFERDFRSKDFALVLEHGGQPVGFTTAGLFDFAWRGESIAVLFSGDTIVDRAFWGEQELARAWLGQIGRLARVWPDRRMVWFLIVKGHRTYRYLPVFARRYVPCEGGTSDSDLAGLRDAIAADMFGTRFDPASGTIHFDMPRGRLRDEFADPTHREAGLPGVAYFLNANPGFRAGDELACLCDLSRDNMRPRARRWFDEGRDEG